MVVYRVKVLRKRAERHEQKGMQSYKVHPERLSAFEELLNDIYTVCRPNPRDYEVRRDLVCVFNEIAKDIYGRSSNVPVVEEFGSFVMDLFHSKSDLDLSVNFNNSLVEISHEKKIQTLRKFARKLYALQRCGHVSGVHPITTAKVPILKVIDCGTKVECDISVENRDGVSKSKIIYMICSIDERFQKLSFLMKAWAKAHNINSSRDKTLNSLSIILLVAFHLQTRNPPILPPFSALLEDGSDPDAVAKSLSKFVNYGKRNKESVAELLATLLIKLQSVEKLWAKGLCASTYEASWISKTWDSKACCISVEDFTDRSQNVARAVGKGEVKRIYKCIQRTSEYITAYMDGLVEVSKLRYYLFGHAAPFQVDSKTIFIEENGNKTSLPCRDIKNKADQSTEGQKGMPSETVMSKQKWSAKGWEGLPSEAIATKQKWSTEGWEGLSSEPITTKRKWSTEGWEGLTSKPITTKGKWSTEGWETTKQKWSTEGWERSSSVSWGQSKEDCVPPHFLWTKRKRSEETRGGTSEPIMIKQKWSAKGWEGLPSEPITTKQKWSTEGWERSSSVSWGQSKEDCVPPDTLLTKRKRSEETRGGTSEPIMIKQKWSAKGWEGLPSEPITTKRKWSTEGWERLPSVSWGQSKEVCVPPNSLWTKQKRSEDNQEGTSAQWSRKSDTNNWFKRKHANNKCAPVAKWTNKQTGGKGKSKRIY